MKFSPLPDHREIFFPLIGPLMVIYYPVPKGKPISKLEAVCHHCGPGWFRYTIEECHRVILEHLWSAHCEQPKPVSRNVLRAPGR